MLKIRLSSRGKKNSVFYKITVSDIHLKRSGKFIDDIGYYNPKTKEYKLDKDKYQLYVAKGAQVSNSLRKLINSH